MSRKILGTKHDLGPLILRLALGAMILPHGAQKALGWFGGGGLEPTIDYFTGTLGFPVPLAVAVIAAELLGGLALLVGALGRVAALAVGAVMVGAVFTTHLQHGFFMNWFGTQAGEGFEFHLLAIGMAIVLMLKGSGALSLDRALASRLAGR